MQNTKETTKDELSEVEKHFIEKHKADAKDFREEKIRNSLITS